MIKSLLLRKLNLLILLWLLFIAALGYFVLINTVFAEQRLTPDLAEVLGLDSEQEVNNINLTIDIEGYKHRFALHQITYPDWQRRLVAYGRGADFLQVIKQGLAAASGQYDLWQTVIDTSRLSNSLPVSQASSDDYVKVDPTGWITGCTSNKYDLQLYTTQLQKIIIDALNNSTSISNIALRTSWQEISANSQIKQLFDYCQKYKTDSEKIYSKFNEIIHDRNSLEYVFGYLPAQDKWEIRRTESLVEYLNQYKDKEDIEPIEGEYNLSGNYIHLTKSYRIGKEMLVHESVKSIVDWLSNINADINPVFRDLPPVVTTLGKEILDFTKLASKGATRIDLIRDGAYNTRADFVVYGLEGIQDTVVMPGQQFSYIDTANPDRGRFIKNGRPVGNGFCMATTTIFRAALEGGFPITERYQHGYNFSSYAWSENNKYPYNLVDAAYYTSPEVDLKFINNTNYPILIKATASRESDGYQYNYIHIYTSSKSPTREVSLVNWQLTSDRGKGLYGQRISGSFERIVKENGNVILQDKYFSSYR